MNKDYFEDNMSDNEIRIIGSEFLSDEKNGSQEQKSNTSIFKGKKKYWLYGITALAVVGLIVVCILLIHRSNSNLDTRFTQIKPEHADEFIHSAEQTVSNAPTTDAFLTITDTMIHNIPLQIYSPHGGWMDVQMGPLSQDSRIMLALPAADIRSDIDAPTGAFVYHGELISKGSPKYGYCAIINDEVTIGRELETRLFERAIEQNGSFFRQYSLVSQGQVITIPPKGKALRRALCMLNGELQVVMSQERMSFIDFSQALVDLGVEEAISLPGGDAILQYITENGEIISQGQKFLDKPKAEQYLVWKKG